MMAAGRTSKDGESLDCREYRHILDLPGRIHPRAVEHIAAREYCERTSQRLLPNGLMRPSDDMRLEDGHIRESVPAIEIFGLPTR